MQTIPLPTGAAFFAQRVELEGVSYLLDFSWNARQAAWILSVFDADGNALVRGITCVSNRCLLRRYKSNALLPRGDLMFHDPTRTIDVANFDQFGTDVSLIYFLAEEVAG